MQRGRAALSFQCFSIIKRRAWLSPGEWLRRWHQLCERSFIATQCHRRDSHQAQRVPDLRVLPMGTAMQPKQTEYIELRCFLGFFAPSPSPLSWLERPVGAEDPAPGKQRSTF